MKLKSKIEWSEPKKRTRPEDRGEYANGQEYYDAMIKNMIKTDEVGCFPDFRAYTMAEIAEMSKLNNPSKIVFRNPNGELISPAPPEKKDPNK